MHGPDFGTMIVSNPHFTAGNTASAFEDIELFHCGMTVRGIAGAGCKTEDRGGPSGNRIKGEQLGHDARSDSPPGSLRRFDEGQSLRRLLKRDLDLPIPDPLGGHETNQSGPDKIRSGRPARLRPTEEEANILSETSLTFIPPITRWGGRFA